MSVEEYTNLENSSNDFDRKKRAMLHISETQVRFHINEVRVENPELFGRELFLKGLERFIEITKKSIPEKEKELADLLHSLGTLTTEDEKEFIKITADKLADFIASSFTTEEIEDISRRRARRQNVLINRLIEYGVTDNILHIHAPVTFLDNPLELRTLFLDAMHKLADKLKNDHELSGIDKITAKSWIVAKAKRAFKEAGFTIVEENKDQGYAKAEISKEKLIDLYLIK